MKTSRRALNSASVLLLLAALPARAQWTIDGAPLCTSPGNQFVNDMIPVGAGVAIAVWGDTRSGNTDIYAQKLDAAGSPQWALDGVVVCNAVNNQFNIRGIADGAGGAILVWQDPRSGFGDVYAQRINSSGAALWTANGVGVCTAPGSQIAPFLVADGAGGAIITWTDYRAGNPNTDIYAQRINSAGAVQWAADGVAVCAPPSTQYYPTIATDGAGGSIITWMDDRTSPNSYDIYAQRINSAGSALWTATGVVICAGPGDQLFPEIVADGAGGAIIAWQTDYDDLYAQRVNSTGAVQWAANGVAVCTAPGFEAQGALIGGVVADGSGGAVFAWDDTRNGGLDIYGQRMNGSGVAQWTANGVAVCTAAGDQQYPRVASDGAGGAVIAWEDSRSGAFDIYSQRVNTTGAPQWTADGAGLCAAGGDQLAAVVVGDGSGGALVAWTDPRSGNNDAYAERVLSNGHATSFTVNSTAIDFVTGTLMEAIAQANAIPGAQTIRFDIPGPGPHVIDAFVYTIPAITDALTIDGFTQPGSAPNTNPIGSPSNAQIQVEIMGWTVVGLDFQATGTVRGVAINGFGSCISAGAPYVVVEGNYIGTDHTGTQYPPFLQHLGVLILGDHCRVGGSTPASRNVIGYGTEAGIRIYGAPNAEVYGNYIGVGADAATNFGSSIGVDIMNNATAARIGSSTIGTNLNPAESNLIMNNFKNVVVRGAGSIGNFIAGNSMLGTYLMIDLNDDSYTLNDALDTDAGPNGLQNYPVLSSAAGSQINGTMDGAANVPLYLHFYWSADCCLNAVHYVGGTVVTLDANGSSPFAFSPAGPIPPGVAISATATDMGGNTSEVAYAVTYQNTGSGSSQVATLMSAGGTMYGSATFATVTAAGNTYTTNPYMPPVPVSGYAIGNPNDPQIYFNITTDAAYTGGVDICLNYDESNIPGPEANLVLLHYDGSMWLDVTTARDLVNNKICGHVTSLSPFVIGAVTPTGADDTPLPASFVLHANVPNPFNPITTIHYDIPAGGADVNITVFDVAGRLVRALVNEHRAPGTWSVEWNGEDDRGARVASGVYFYRMRAGSFVDTKKMVLLK